MKKILDKQGKLLGLINPIDLAVLMILLVLVIQLIVRFWPAPFTLREEPVTIGLLARNVPVYLAESLKPGQELYDDKTGISLGQIMTKKVQPAELLLTIGNKLVPVQSPRQVDLRLEVVRRGRMILSQTHQGIYLTGVTARIGMVRPVHTLYTTLRMEIETLKVGQ